ncbi:hypothetical protein J6590_012549 [Homalodisca vitripennis]|nr:hypothetical protein J6590_012549 [Homalodisca vitripennis]
MKIYSSMNLTVYEIDYFSCLTDEGALGSSRVRVFSMVLLSLGAAQYMRVASSAQQLAVDSQRSGGQMLALSPAGAGEMDRGNHSRDGLLTAEPAT